MAEDEGDGEQTSVRVAVRVRPMSQKELNEGGEVCVEVLKDGQSLNLNSDGQGPHSFAFDHVFGDKSTQPEVFQKLGVPLLDKAFEGYNSTIFAYGQTGSGKTHTMMSDRKSDDRGLIPRISENLFERITALTSDARKFLVQCSFLEIYNEIVYDLLVPRGKSSPKTGLEIREQKGIGVYVKDLQEIVVDSAEKLQKLIDQGFEHRATAATQMNATSSRSHCLFIIKMHQKDDSNASNNNFSKMNLVDLAGSERASRTGAQGDTLKEGANINKSLSSLGNVINALSSMASGKKKVFIPYRDSKLTRVLQESLGGNALTTMMAACSPSKTNADETLSTLNYAKRAKTIKVNAQKNEEAEQIAKLEQEVEALRAKLAEQASGAVDNSKYSKQIEEMENFMKQTWEDKEKASQQHENERKALEKEAEKGRQQALAEKNRRLKLLEDKGDIELSIQDLRSHTADAGVVAYTATWLDQTKKLTSLQQRITAQCRAVGLIKEAVIQDVGHWCEQRKGDDEGGAASRMLLSQAARKAANLSKEIESLSKLEGELECNLAVMTPEVRRTVSILQVVIQEAKTAEKDEAEADKSRKQLEGIEEFGEILSLVSRQLDTHRSKAWSQVAKEHKQLGTFGKDLSGMLECCKELGIDTSGLSKELELEVGGSSSSTARGVEEAAALSRPLGLCDGALPDGALSTSSNPEAALSSRLMGGVEVDAFGGWCPARDAGDEYVQVDFGAPKWISGVGIQGRQPAVGIWEQTRPLVAKVLAPDPLPPKRIFQRPPVRLIHDVVVAAHSRHKAFEAAGGDPFQDKALDYKSLQKFDRQQKVDFFDSVVSKTNACLKALNVTEVPDVTITPDDILRGKNTSESNRLLQLISYLVILKKGGANAGGLLQLADQWVTKYRLYWSADGQQWAASMSGSEPVVIEGSSDPSQVCYTALGDNSPKMPVRYLRVYPAEWVRHPGFRFEVYGWSEGEEASLPKELGDRNSRLDVLRDKAASLKKHLDEASVIATEQWRSAQKAGKDQAEQVEAQLQEARAEIEELGKAKATMEQQLIDADTEKLKIEVDRDRAQSLVQELEGKLSAISDAMEEEKKKVSELEEQVTEQKNVVEDLNLQIGVVTEERDNAREKEEELYDKLTAKEEELMDTNDGYVRLTDQLGEVRDELDESVFQRDRVIEQLNTRNQELLDEGMKLRQREAELKRKLEEAEKALRRAAEGLPISFAAKAASPDGGYPQEEKAKNPSPEKKKEEDEDSNYADDFDDE